MKKLPFLLFSLLFTIFKSHSQNRTVGVVKYETSQQDGYFLYSPFGTKKSFLVDKCGRKIREWNSDYTPGFSVRLTPDGKCIRAGAIDNSNFGAGVGGILERYDWDGNLEWKFVLSDSANSFHHDFQLMPNGHILAIVWESHSIADATDNGRDPANTKTNIWSERIVELAPKGTDSADIVWQWCAWDHMVQDFDASKANYGVVKNHRELFDINYTNGAANYGQDWFHMNGIDYNPVLDQILLTSHTLDEIYIIDHSTSTAQASGHSGGRSGKGGDILYRWGNPESYEMGSTGTHRLFHPHHANWITGTNINAGAILIYNNGLGRPVSQYTSADMIKPSVQPDGTYPFASGKPFSPDTQMVVFHAANKTSFFSSVMGGVFCTGNNRYMVTDATGGSLMEVSNDTHVIWKYVNPVTGSGSTRQGSNPGTNWVFRFEFYTPDFSGFTNKDMAPGTELETNPYSKKPCDKSVVPIYPIALVNRQSKAGGVCDSLNVYCGIRGTIQGPNMFSGGINIILADSSGSMHVLQSGKTFGKTYTAGDSILVYGTVGQTNGWGTLINLDSVIILGTKRNTKPVMKTSAPGENYESQLIQLHRVKLANPASWPVTSMAKNTRKPVAIVHGNGSTDTMMVFDATNLDGSPAPSGYFDITGFVGQFWPATNNSKSYAIFPRNLTDIVPATMPVSQFTKNLDTATSLASQYTISMHTILPEENFQAQLIVKGGNAVQGKDYFFSTQTVSFVQNNASVFYNLSISSNPDFTGNRNIVFALRNASGAGTIGADSVFTLVLRGKTTQTNQSHLEVKSGIQLFPNPVQGQFQILCQEDLKLIELFASDGRMVEGFKPNGTSITIKCEHAPGMYLVAVTTVAGNRWYCKLQVNNP